jgi:hypothetical protein
MLYQIEFVHLLKSYALSNSLETCEVAGPLRCQSWGIQSQIRVCSHNHHPIVAAMERALGIFNDINMYLIYEFPLQQ